MISSWLDQTEWEYVQSRVPIACVDILPIKLDDNLSLISAIGLILRDTPHQGHRWCVVGGRLLREESLEEAITRQLLETLGTNIHFDIPTNIEPTHIAQYFVNRPEQKCLDPRQHALGITYCIPITGQPFAQGEAYDFKWFDIHQLPLVNEIGFDQQYLLNACLSKLNTK